MIAWAAFAELEDEEYKKQQEVMKMKPKTLNETLNKQISQIITLFGSDPNAVAMGMIDDIQFLDTKRAMLADIKEIVEEDEPIKLYCVVADGFGGGHQFVLALTAQQVAMRLNHPQALNEDYTYFATKQEAQQYITNMRRKQE